MDIDKYVPGCGNTSAKIAIVGEAPSYVEVAARQPFMGPSGNELNKLLKDAGINRSDCWVTNLCKYEVPPNVGQKKTKFSERAAAVGIDINAQIHELQYELSQIRPNVILALGGTALWGLTGKTKISKFRGSILSGMGYKVIPTYHPAHLLHAASGGEIKGYWNRQVMIFDFKRALTESNNPIIELPSRNIQICTNSGQLYDFLKLYKDKPYMAVDIEAGGHCLPICVGLAFTRHHAMVVPLWNRDGISSIPDSDLTNCWKLVADALWEKEIIGANFNYDRDKIKRIGFVIRKLRSDVMLKAFSINPELPKGLAFNTSIYTREPFYKDEGMYEGEMRDLFHGCGKDACVTVEIDEEMEADLEELGVKKFYYNFVMTLPDFYLEIENNGFRVNNKVRDELIHKYVEMDENLSYELFKIAGIEVNAGSPDQVASLLFDHWKLPRRKGTGEEELTALLNLKQGVKDEEQRRAIGLILEQRRVRKTISTYLMALPDFDGKMRTTCFPCLETGRSSNGQQEPPIRPKYDLVGKGRKNDMKVLGTAFQTLTKHGDIGSDVRRMYIPDEGEIFVQLDSSQAEARVVFNLAGDEQALQDIDEHDYHALTASWFFGGTESDHSKKVKGYETPKRFAGKTLRHAGHLGAKERRAAIELNTQARKYKIDVTITEAQARHALNIFHLKQPKIQKVFHAEVIEALKSRKLTAPLPWGIDAERGGVRIFYERWGDDLFREALAYLPQRAVTDNTKAAGIRIKKKFRECKIVLESHDALLFSVRHEYLDDFIPLAKKEMERPIDFSNCSLPRRHLRIPCDVEIGFNYKDLRKFGPPEERVPKPDVCSFVVD